MKVKSCLCTLLLFFIFLFPGFLIADPPPWAPAHGYRHKHKDGTALVFDSGIGVYVAIDFPDIYFSNDKFYKKNVDIWQSSAAIKGPWVNTAIEDIPPGLKNDKNKNKSKGKNKKKKNKNNDKNKK